MKRIGLYGGSFNPPHIGHILAVRHALTFGKLDLVTVLPCWNHAFEKDSDLLPFEERLSMTRLAFSNDERVMVDNLERDLRIRHTVDLVEKMQDHPRSVGTEFVLIIGSDNLADWKKWHRWQDLDRMVEKFIVPRPGTTDSLWALPDVSSTEIRAWIRAGEWGKVEKTVPPKVVEHIRFRNLWLPQ